MVQYRPTNLKPTIKTVLKMFDFAFALNGSHYYKSKTHCVYVKAGLIVASCKTLTNTRQVFIYSKICGET